MSPSLCKSEAWTEHILTLRRGRRFLPPLSPWQVYPLILSLATISQGIIFAVSQGKGLGGFVIEGCIPISQAMMPGMSLYSLFLSDA